MRAQLENKPKIILLHFRSRMGGSFIIVSFIWLTQGFAQTTLVSMEHPASCPEAWTFGTWMSFTSHDPVVLQHQVFQIATHNAGSSASSGPACVTLLEDCSHVCITTDIVRWWAFMLKLIATTYRVSIFTPTVSFLNDLYDFSSAFSKWLTSKKNPGYRRILAAYADNVAGRATSCKNWAFAILRRRTWQSGKAIRLMSIWKRYSVVMRLYPMLLFGWPTECLVQL